MLLLPVWVTGLSSTLLGAIYGAVETTASARGMLHGKSASRGKHTKARRSNRRAFSMHEVTG